MKKKDYPIIITNDQIRSIHKRLLSMIPKRINSLNVHKSISPGLYENLESGELTVIDKMTDFIIIVKYAYYINDLTTTISRKQYTHAEFHKTHKLATYCFLNYSFCTGSIYYSKN